MTGSRGTGGDESAEWDCLLSQLRRRTAHRELSEAQHRTFLVIWGRLDSTAPTLRKPAVGLSLDGALEMSWSFDDLPARSFTTAILRDGSVDWFFRDGRSGRVEGSEDELTGDLPDAAYRTLIAAFTSPCGSTG